MTMTRQERLSNDLLLRFLLGEPVGTESLRSTARP